jgi:hypothetical protein
MSGSRPDADVVTRPMGHWLAGILFLPVGHVGVDARDERLVRLREVGAAGAGCVVSVTGVGRTAMEIAGAREALTDDGGANDLTVAGDELAVGLVAHGELREAGDDERIDDAEENRRDDSEADRDDEGAAHGCALVGTVARAEEFWVVDG